MYNKEISEKMLDDAFDMLHNIKGCMRVCGDIMERAKREYGYELCYLFNLYRNIERIDNKVQEDINEMININGEVKGYDTETYLRLINLYEGIVKNNEKVNDIVIKIRKRYM